MACPASLPRTVSSSPASRFSRPAPGRPTGASKVIDLTHLFHVAPRSRGRVVLHMVLSVWTRYLPLVCLLLYTALRLPLGGGAPLGTYSGPLALLWPASFFLLLTSYCSDLLLWQEDWAPSPQKNAPCR